jgi:hypothetical protein
MLHSPDSEVQFIHKVIIEIGDLYFVRVSNPKGKIIDLGFPYVNRIPYQLDLWTGMVSSSPQYTIEVNRLWIHVEFSPFGSRVFLFPNQNPAKVSIHAIGADVPVFRENSDLVVYLSQSGKYNFQLSSGDNHTIEVSNPPPLPLKIDRWHLKVEKRRISGENDISEFIIGKLFDWRSHPELRYCSGPGVYTASFMLDECQLASNLHWFLELGRVYDSAVVTLNEFSFSPLLVPPYDLDITSSLKVGENRLEIRIQGTLRNLLVGYGHMGAKEYIHHKKKPLMPVGLLGPIQIVPKLRRIVFQNV